LITHHWPALRCIGTEARLIPRNTHMCYLAKCGRSALKNVGINKYRITLEIVERLDEGVADPLNKPLSMCVSTSNLVLVHQRV